MRDGGEVARLAWVKRVAGPTGVTITTRLRPRLTTSACSVWLPSIWAGCGVRTWPR